MDECTSLVSTSEPELAQNRNFRGMLFTASSALLFGAVAAVTKSSGKPVLMFLLGRAITQWILSFALIYSWRPLDASLMESLFGPSGTRGWLVFRGVLYWCFNAFWWWSLRLMPLGDATAIVYTTPVFTASFAFCLLGEVLDATFFICAVMAFIGVLLIVQPSFSTSVYEATDNSPFGPILAMMAAITAGLLPVAVRKVRFLHWTTIEHVTSALGVLLTPFAMAAWVCIDHRAEEILEDAMISTAGWFTVVVACSVEFIGLAMQTIGYQQVKHAATASLINYIEVPFAFVLQSVLYTRRPTGSAILGATLVLAGAATKLFHRDQASPSSGLPGGSSAEGR